MRFNNLKINVFYDEDIGSLHASELEFRIAVFLKELGHERVFFDHGVSERAENLVGCIPSRKAQEPPPEPPPALVRGLCSTGGPMGYNPPSDGEDGSVARGRRQRP